MKPVTFFACPKSFEGQMAIIQTNAVKSWTLLDPKPEIILCGNDKGIAKFAFDNNLLHIPNVKVNEKGTPFLSDVFLKVHELASNDVLVYANCDIIFRSDFMPAVKKVRSNIPGEFLIVGQKFDSPFSDPIDFTDPDWEIKLQQRIQPPIGKYHKPTGIDYFVFRRGTWKHFPAFLVGRVGWDMWFLAQALIRKHKVVDATKAIFAVHQKHDYSHMGGKEEIVWGDEARYNATRVPGIGISLHGQSIARANCKIEDL